MKLDIQSFLYIKLEENEAWKTTKQLRKNRPRNQKRQKNADKADDMADKDGASIGVPSLLYHGTLMLASHSLIFFL